MLAGLFLRGYKVYKNVKFLPFFDCDHENLNLFIGPNGVGKSSILEALDTFFNNAKWTISLGSQHAYVAPIFLIEKKKVEHFSTTSKEYIEKISAFLWNVKLADNKLVYSTISDFLEFKDKIRSTCEQDYYLLLLSFTPHLRDISFATFDAEIKKTVLNLTFDEENNLKKNEQKPLNKLFTEVHDLYTYIYIPTETNIANFLRLESKDMQELTDRRIIDNIDVILTNKSVPQENGEISEKKNILDLINEKLQPYVAEVERIIQQIDIEYRFQAEGTAKLTTKDISRQIINAFYSKRKLQKDGKSIADLSSGERKKALIDITYSFLSQEDRGAQEKEIILAIDEPEASLDMSIRYDQFERIEKLAKDHQIFIATHWYGSLPIIQQGIIHHIEIGEDGLPVIRLYNSRYYFEDRKNDPNDIYFKSFSDLSQSILSSIRSKEMNWIIVEGPEDKNYLDYYLKGQITNLKILPVGGSGSVKLLYQHMSIPFSVKSDSSTFKGRVFCLVDTDNQGLDIKDSDSKYGKLRIRRFQLGTYSGTQEIKLVKINNAVFIPTEIEEVLVPNQFYLALKKTIEASNDENVKLAFSYFKYDDDSKFSFVKGDLSILLPQSNVERNYKSDKKLIIDFIDRNKFLISHNYCKMNKEVEPAWIGDIIKLFNQDGYKENNSLPSEKDKLDSTIINQLTEELSESMEKSEKLDIDSEIKTPKNDVVPVAETIVPSETISPPTIVTSDVTTENLSPPPVTNIG